jgi:hypothetical protein
LSPDSPPVAGSLVKTFSPPGDKIVCAFINTAVEKKRIAVKMSILIFITPPV